ncbi:MAG: glucose-6-phosphate isomerase [Candidatus Azambacteria bacterium]|nr:glucose-6-phosphate isomerase [Candidatus Azambacteria bacterium]
MALDLQKISGLPISFDLKSLKLEFQGDFPFIKKSERSLGELRPYLKNLEAEKCPPAVGQGPDPVYYVWRYVHLKKDDKKIKALNLRYDITLIPPGKIDDEFAKTAGHFHKNKTGTNLPYPEIYEVLMGRAYFLIQSPGKDTKNIKAVRLIEAGPGEKVLVPPDFSGHTTINVFNEPLIIANWISDDTIYDYESYKNNHGASYYFLDNGDLIDIVKNPNYDSVPEIKKIRAKKDPLPLYNLVNNLDKLRFLNYPEEYPGEWRNW